MRDKLLSIIQGVDEPREVWREEVQELMAWTPKKGELVEEGGEAEVMRGVREEEVRGEVEEQPPKRRKVAVVREGGGGGGFEEGGEGSVGGGRSVRKDLGGGLWGVKEARSAVIPRSQRKPPPSRSRSRGEGSRGEGRQVEVEREREDLSRSVQGGRGRRPHVRSEGAGPDVGESFWTGGSGKKNTNWV